MAAHQHSTTASDFHRCARPLAPARIMIGGDFVALLDSRANVERTIERLIGVLDDFDAESEDLEAEFDDDPEDEKERGGDEEPNLGSLDANFGQEHWACGGTMDYEHEDRARSVMSIRRPSLNGGRHV